MKEKRILLYGEGKTDYGTKNYGKITREESVYTEQEWLPGPIVHFIKKCAVKSGQDISIEYAEKECIDGKRRIKLGKKQMDELKRQGMTQGKALPARRFKIFALEKGFQFGIFYCDTDKIEKGKNTDKQACRKEFERIYREVDVGLDGAGSNMWKGLPMIALKMIECWLLSDENAYKLCFGSTPRAPVLPRKPELIWGSKGDKNSDYPKNYMDRILCQYQKESGLEIFNEIAEKTEADVLKDKCDISFQKFYIDIQKFLED